MDKFTTYPSEEDYYYYGGLLFGWFFEDDADLIESLNKQIPHYQLIIDYLDWTPRGYWGKNYPIIGGDRYDENILLVTLSQHYFKQFQVYFYFGITNDNADGTPPGASYVASLIQPCKQVTIEKLKECITYNCDTLTSILKEEPYLTSLMCDTHDKNMLF
jgi:hypothetical protein